MSGAASFLDELFRRAGEQDLDAVLDLWHDDGILDDVTLGLRSDGKDAVTAYLREFFAAFPELAYTPKQIITEGNRGVVHWESSTTVAAPFFGFPPSAEPIPLRGCDIFEVRDGRVAHEWSWYGDAWLALRLAPNPDLARSLQP